LSARRHFSSRLLAEGPEAGAKLFGKELRLFPRGEVAALLNLVVVDEVGIGTLRPTSGGLVEFVGEHAHGNWNGDALRTEKGELVFPIEACRRNCRVCQPEQRDIVEDVVWREAFGLPVERTRDEFQTARVVIEQEGREANRRVRKSGHSLRACSHPEGVVNMLVEENELIVRT
jgi:hypothetical protein